MESKAPTPCQIASCIRSEMGLLLESPRATLNHAHRSSESRRQLPQAALFNPVGITDGLSNGWGQKGARRAPYPLALGTRVPHACFDAFNDKRSFKLSHGSPGLRSLPGGWTSLAGFDERRDPRAVPPLKSCGFGRHLGERLTFPSENPAPLRILWEMDTSPASPKPHMFAVEFERHPGDSGATAIVLADGPQAARLGRRPPGAKGRRAGRGQPL